MDGDPAETGLFLRRIVLHISQDTDENNGAYYEEDTVFCATGYTLLPDAVGEWFDTVDVTISYPDGTEAVFLENVGNAYLVKNAPMGTMAAVQFSDEENYYLFRSEALSDEEYRNLLTDSGILQ